MFGDNDELNWKFYNVSDMLKMSKRRRSSGSDTGDLLGIVRLDIAGLQNNSFMLQQSDRS